MKFRLILCSACLLVLQSCHLGDLEFNKIKGPIYSPSAAFIVGSAKYTIKELVEDIKDERLEIIESDDLFLTFVYIDSADFENSDDFIAFDDIVNTSVIEPGFTSPVSPVEVTIPVSKIFEFEYPSTDNDLVDSVFYNSGSLELNISSTFRASGTYTISIPGTKDIITNEDFLYSGVLDFNGTLPVIDQEVVSLIGFKTLLSTVSGQNTFQLIFNGELVVPVGSFVTATDAVDISLTISNPNFSAVFGDFGTDTTELQNQSIDLDGFEEFGESGLELFAPVLRLEVENSYGLPLGISLDGFQAINNNNTAIPLTGEIVDNLTIINAPTVAGETASTIFEINTNNSNISELLSSTPIRLEVPVNGSANPVGSNALTNFLTDSSDVSLRAVIEIPLEMRMNGFSRAFDFDISDFSIDDATSITMRIISINELPLTGSIDLQFLSESGDVLHEILNQSVLASPSVGTDGRTIGAETLTTDIVLDQDGIDGFVRATKILVNMNVSSFDQTNGTFVKIFSDYALELELSFFGQFIIEL